MSGLRDNGYDDIIKNNVSVSFGRGEDEIANAFKAVVEKEGYIPQQDTSIHAGTLKAFVRERRSGRRIPNGFIWRICWSTRIY